MIAPTTDAIAARLPRWANTALVAAIGLALASVAVKLFPADVRLPSGPVAASAAPGGGGAVDPLERARQTASLHVFGDAERVVDEPAPVVEAPKKETSLNLQLAGVYAAEPQELAVAIISSGSAEQNAYGVGDRITSEVVLKSVHPSYVVLTNRGTDEILKLPDDVAPIAATPIQSASYDASAQAASSASQGQDLSQPLELPSNPGELRDTLARNPSMLGRVVAAEPYQENGKLVGYRITPKQNPEILEAQGIIAGDVITRVNDIQLNSQKQGIRALRNAVKAESLAVTVLRDGVEIPISISLSQ